MAIDMRQFHQTFFEESLEGLAHMEAELLRLERAVCAGAAADPEMLNTIFRDAHSIKGGSSTFGFSEVATFSHTLESLLDAMRAGRQHPDERTVSLLLQSVDCLRGLVQAAQSGEPIVQEQVNRLRAKLEGLQGKDAPERSARTKTDAAAQIPASLFNIVFRPNSRLFHSGNDPLRLLRELAGLGALTVRSDLSALPVWEEMNPEECYLAWNLELTAAASLAAVKEIFDWVNDDCTVEIAHTPVSDSVATQSPVASESYTAADTSVGSIRVSIPKVDGLINMVGELVITQSMLSQVATNFTMDSLPKLLVGLTQLERNTRELQESVMRIRMLPLSFTFNRLPRMVRDMSHKLEKNVELQINGEHTELDKTVIERMGDPLLHLVRNCLDHGIEPPAERRAAGKPETGTIEISAYQKSGSVVIEVNDDGRGLQRDKILAKAIERGLAQPGTALTDTEIRDLIFTPGFSTSETINDVSGRGVGMDVVRSNIASLGGSVDLSSLEGQGTRFTVRLPLTLAILDGLSVLVGEHIYILPLASISESIRLTDAQVSRLAGGAEVFPLRNEYLPLIRLHKVFSVKPRSTDLGQGSIVVVEVDDNKYGLHVDDLLGQQQVVIKNLEAHYRRVQGISAATILGDGTVAMILDIAGLVQMTHAAETRGASNLGDDHGSNIRGIPSRSANNHQTLRG